MRNSTITLISIISNHDLYLNTFDIIKINSKANKAKIKRLGSNQTLVPSSRWETSWSRWYTSGSREEEIEIIRVDWWCSREEKKLMVEKKERGGVHQWGARSRWHLWEEEDEEKNEYANAELGKNE